MVEARQEQPKGKLERISEAELKMLDIVSSQPKKSRDEIEKDLKYMGSLYQEYNNTVERTVIPYYDDEGKIIDLRINRNARVRQIGWVAKKMYKYLFKDKKFSSHL